MWSWLDHFDQNYSYRRDFVKATGFKLIYCESYWLRIWERFLWQPFSVIFRKLEVVSVKMIIVLSLPQFCVTFFFSAGVSREAVMSEHDAYIILIVLH